ncbi:MAG: glycosyltransferase family 2 protein [Burkholderiales bacterium]|nr:glycosyltransferase family 2 protein [Burkholderiales bacterium]
MLTSPRADTRPTGLAAVTRPAAASAWAAAGGVPDAPLRQGRVPTVSCVVPGRNEARNLGLLLPLLAQTLSRLVERWEIIVVDDGSTDDTAERMAQWSRMQPALRLVQLSRNFGKEAALSAGLQAARGDVVVQLDADVQHPPKLIETMLARWRAGADVVYAVRRHRDDEGRIKRLGTRWFYRLLNGGHRFEVPAGAGDFRLMDRAVVDALLALPERNRFMKGLYAWVGFQAEALPYQPDERAFGESHYSLWQLMRLSLDGLTAFTKWPLRAVSVAGMALALPAFFYGGYLTLMHWIYGNPVSGWTTIVVGVMLFSGAQMLAIGVVGEYIGRIYDEVKGRPLYVVKREVGRGLPAEGR